MSFSMSTSSVSMPDRCVLCDTRIPNAQFMRYPKVATSTAVWGMPAPLPQNTVTLGERRYAYCTACAPFLEVVLPIAKQLYDEKKAKEAQTR